MGVGFGWVWLWVLLWVLGFCWGLFGGGWVLLCEGLVFGVWVWVVVRCVCFMCVLGVCVCVVAGVLVAWLVGCGVEGTAEPVACAVIMGLSQICFRYDHWGNL